MTFVEARKALLVSCAVGTLAFPHMAAAQPADSTASGTPSVEMPDVQSSQDSAGISEILVTASKRPQDLQKTPAAISVVGGDNIEAAGVTDATFLSKLVPSLVIGKRGPARTAGNAIWAQFGWRRHQPRNEKTRSRLQRRRLSGIGQLRFGSWLRG